MCLCVCVCSTRMFVYCHIYHSISHAVESSCNNDLDFKFFKIMFYTFSVFPISFLYGKTRFAWVLPEKHLFLILLLYCVHCCAARCRSPIVHFFFYILFSMNQPLTNRYDKNKCYFYSYAIHLF